MRLFRAVLLAAVLGFGCKPNSQQDQAVVELHSEKPVFQVGIVLDSSAANSDQMSFSQKRRGGKNTNKILNVYKISGLDDTALDNKWQVWQRGDTVCAEVYFKGRARDQLADVSRTNIGKDLAVIVDGRISWTMEIGGEVTNGCLPVLGDWTLKDAQAFCKKIEAARLNAKR